MELSQIAGTQVAELQRRATGWALTGSTGSTGSTGLNRQRSRHSVRLSSRLLSRRRTVRRLRVDISPSSPEAAPASRPRSEPQVSSDNRPVRPKVHCCRVGVQKLLFLALSQGIQV